MRFGSLGISSECDFVVLVVWMNVVSIYIFLIEVVVYGVGNGMKVMVIVMNVSVFVSVMFRNIRVWR